MREKLTELAVQKIWLSHPLTGDPVNRYGIINETLRDDGETAEISFPFDVAVNEELNHILFGEDYEIRLEQPVGSQKIEIGNDGTYFDVTGVPIRIVDLELAIASSTKGSVKIVPELTDSSFRSISFSPDTNRFSRTTDLKGKSIDLYRATAVYPRWIESRKAMTKKREGGLEIERLEDQPLKEMNLHCFVVEDGINVYRSYLAKVRNVPVQERKNLMALQPKKARRIKLHDLVLTARNPIFPA
jgi:hypothetical protein